MGQFIVLHMEKRMEVSPILERHIIRLEVKYVDRTRTETVWVPDNADESRVHFNRELVSRNVVDPLTGKTKTLTIQQAVNRRIKDAGIKKVRSNQNTCIEIIFSGSTDTMCTMSQEQVNNWANDTLTWAQSKWGKDNVVSATLHCDEKTPHMHVILVPIVQGQSRRSASKAKKNKEMGVTVKKYIIDTTKNRLCANEVYTQPLLYGYHSSYAESVGEKYGLSRGIRAEKGSFKKHTDSIEYNRMLAQQAAEEEQLIKELRSDYAEIEERLNIQNRKMVENSRIIEKQVEDYKIRNNIIDEINKRIENKMNDLKSLSLYGLLEFIKDIPTIIKSEVQDRVKTYWKGTVQSFKLDSVNVEDELCDIVKIDMLNDNRKYYIEVRLADGLVWYNGATEPHSNRETGKVYMKELANYFTELTPNAKELVKELFKEETTQKVRMKR